MEDIRDYDNVADIYAEVFHDIRVRGPEIKWLLKQLPDKKFSLLEIGCGSGSLLNMLADRVSKALGVDVSGNMIKIAAEQNKSHPHIRFGKIKDHHLPPEINASVDIVISMLSWRYVDWLPLLKEIMRVIKPGGKLLVIDMTGKQAGFWEYPLVFTDKMKTVIRKSKSAEFSRKLEQMVKLNDWKRLVRNNPVKKYSSYISFFKKYLPGSRRAVPDRSLSIRILALNSGALVPNLGTGRAVIDWGIGGFGIYQMIKKEFPKEPVCYLSDSGFRPYGKCSSKVLVRRLQQLVDFLIIRGVTQVIVACNAMSTILESENLIIPKGMEITGVIKPAVEYLLRQEPESISVIGGKQTVRSGAYRKQLSQRHRVSQTTAQLLSGMIESGDKGSALLVKTLKKIISPLKESASMILGCTHYPAILRLFRQLLPDMKIIDPAEITFNSVVRHWILPESNAEKDVIMTSGSGQETKDSAMSAFGVKLEEVMELEINFGLRD